MSTGSSSRAGNPLAPNQGSSGPERTPPTNPLMVQRRDAPLPPIPKDSATSTSPAAPGISTSGTTTPPGATLGATAQKGTTMGTTTPPGAPPGATSGTIAPTRAGTGTTTSPGAPSGTTSGGSTGTIAQNRTGTGTTTPPGAPPGATSGAIAPKRTTTDTTMPPGAPPGTTSSATAQEGTTASATTPTGTVTGATAPPGSSSNPNPVLDPLPPSPSKPVAGYKHKVKRREEFDNKKSSKRAAGSSAPPLLLRPTPKKNRRFRTIDERPVAGALPSLVKTLRTPLRAVTSPHPATNEYRDRGQGPSERPMQLLHRSRASSSMSSVPIPQVYTNAPQAAEQQTVPQQLIHPQAMPQQQLVHPQAMPQQQLIQQQAMPPQQLFQQQPGLYAPFVHVPPPVAYPMQMQPQNPVAGYHAFPQSMPQQPAQMLNTSVWEDYHEGRAAERFSTPRRALARRVHYELDEDEEDEDEDEHLSRYDLSNGEESDDEDGEEMEYDLDTGDVEVDIEEESQDLEEHEEAYQGGPEDEEDEDMDERPKDDHMEDVEEDVGWPGGGRQAGPIPGSSGNRSTEEMEVLNDDVFGRIAGGSTHSTAHRHQSELGSNGPDERGARRKGKERATNPVTTPPTRPSRARVSQSPQRERVLPSQDRGAFYLLLLQQFSEFNEVQREENRLNRQWQQNMLQYVKKLDNKVSRGAGVMYSSPGRTQARRVKAHRERPSNSMASRIVLPPQDRVISPEEQERLEAKEKAHLADLQNVVRVHLKKLLGVTSYNEMAEHHPPLNDEEIFNYEISGPQYFTEANFRVDFSRPWKEFPFNLSARDFFANHLLRVLQGGGYKKASIPVRYHTYDHIGEALDVHMDHARKCYREILQPPAPADKEKEKRKSRMVSRRGTLHKSRFRVTKEVQKYNRYSELLVNLSGAHMSGDETDRDENGAKGHPVTYTITRAAWMSSAFRRLCRELDKENIETRDTLIGDQGSGGNGPRIRQESAPPREADTRAPSGLWRNCYNSVWLAGLKEDQVRRLEMVDEDFDLRLPADMPSEDEEEL